MEASGTFGNLFTAMGMGVEPATDMSLGLVQLAADLGSFNNMEPGEVLEKLRSGLVGETEPLRSLGVNLTAAAVEAKALEMGLAGTTAELTPAMLAQARYALILEQTKTAQGDFARTSDGFANGMRTLKAQFVDAAAGIGQLLLPYVTQLVGWIQQGIGWFQGLNPEMQKWIVIIGVVAAALGPAIMIIGTLVSALGTILPIVGAVAGVLTFPLIAIIAAVVAIAALLAAAWKNNWGDIQGKTAAVVAWIKTAIQGFLAAITAFWAAHGEQIMATIKALWDGVVKIFNIGIGILKTVVAAFQAAFAGDWTRFGELLRVAWDKTWALLGTILKAAIDTLVTIFKTLWPKIVSWFNSVDWGQVGKNIIIGIGNGITAMAGFLRDLIKKVIQAALDAITGFFGLNEDINGAIDGVIGLDIAKTVSLGVGAAGGAGMSGDRAGVMIFGGVHLYGVESGKGMLEEIQALSV